MENSKMSNATFDEIYLVDETPKELFTKDFKRDETPDDGEAYAEFVKSEPYDIEAKTLEAVRRWRAAKSLLQLRRQVDAAFPRRNKASDGTIGDQRHCGGGGRSDHCPNIRDGGVGVVTAIDITHDPNSGCDAQKIVDAIRSDRDERVKYIIWNRKIFNSKAIGGAAPWEGRRYNGANPHTKHVHISVLPTKARYDDVSEWSIGTNAAVG